MLNNRNVLFIIAIAFVVVFLSAFGYFFVTDTVSMASMDNNEPVKLTTGTTLSLDRGWTSYSDSSLQNEIELEPAAFRTGDYYFRLLLDTQGM